MYFKGLYTEFVYWLYNYNTVNKPLKFMFWNEEKQTFQKQSHWANRPLKVLCRNSFSQTTATQGCESTCCQRFLYAGFLLWPGKPQRSICFELYLPQEDSSQKLLTAEISLGDDAGPAGRSECHRRISGPAWQGLPVGSTQAIWKWLKQALKQQALETTASLARAELTLLVYSAKHSCLWNVWYPWNINSSWC